MNIAERRDLHEVPFSGFTRRLQQTDIPFLKPILETWVRDRKTHELLNEEVEEILSTMKDSIVGKNDRTYFVAETEDGNIAGSIGMRKPDPRLFIYTRTDNPIEIINAFVSKEHTRQGIGRALINTVEENARKNGFKELILNSGPRYMFSGWPAWTKIFGRPIAIAQDYFGKGIDAPVWRKILSNGL